MIKKSRQHKRKLSAIIDSIAVLVAVSFSILIRYGAEALLNPKLPILAIGMFLCLLVMLFFNGFEMYSVTSSRLKERIIIVILTSVYSFLSCTILYGLIFQSFEHMLLITESSLFMCITLILWREFRIFYKNRKKKKKLLILEEVKEDNSRVRRVKYASPSIYDAWYEQINVENLDDVTRFIENEFPKYDGVCIMESIPIPARDIITRSLISMGKEFFVVPDMYELNFSNTSLSLFEDIMVFQVSPYYITKMQAFVKRTFDIIVSIIGIAMAAIPMMIIALAIKLTSSGPIFYKQIRLTQHKREFNIIKFRTMVQNAEKLSGPVFAEKHDPRITKVGHILRKLRMDELPQLINILIGDMSIVGPRPERPFFVEKFSQDIENYEQRFAVKAGLTSLSHVYGRYSTDIADRTLYDLLYIRNYSLLLDLRILLLSTKVIFIGEASEGVSIVDIYKHNKLHVTPSTTLPIEIINR